MFTIYIKYFSCSTRYVRYKGSPKSYVITVNSRFVSRKQNLCLLAFNRWKSNLMCMYVLADNETTTILFGNIIFISFELGSGVMNRQKKTLIKASKK